MYTPTSLSKAGLLRAALVLAGIAFAAGLIVALSTPADATHSLFRFTGSRDADVFLVEKEADGDLRLCATTCTTRTASAVDAVVVDGFESDDILLVGHGTDLFTDAAGSLPVTFAGGPGMDEIRICGASPPGYPHSLSSCSEALATTVTAGTAENEVRVEQHLGSRFVSLTLQDVAVMQDDSPGGLAVHGTTADDQIMIGTSGARGAVTVNARTPYEFSVKGHLVVDALTGADRINADAVEGLTSATSCAPPTADAAPVCLRADSAGDDSLVTRGAVGMAEAVALATRTGGEASLRGLSAPGPLDLLGVDRVELGLQQSDGDTLRVPGTEGADLLELRPQAAGGPLAVSGVLDRDATPRPLTGVLLSGDGSTGPLAVLFDAGSGADVVDHLGTDRDDTYGLRPPTDGTCSGLGPDLLTHAVDGQARLRMQATAVEQFALDGQLGNDGLELCGLLDAVTTWRGGDGSDSVRLTGSGGATVVDIAADTLQEAGGGLITAVATELYRVVGGERVATVRAADAHDAITVTPTGPAAATVERTGDPRTVRLDAVAAVTVDPGTGDDTVRVRATGGADDIAVNRGFSATDSLAVAIGAWVPVRAAVPATEIVALDALGGDDRFTIAGDHGPPSLTLDGGSDADGDRMLVGYPVTDARVTLDAGYGAGQVFVDGPPVVFQGLEVVDLEGDGLGVVTILGSDTADVLQQQGDTLQGAGTLVRWSEFPTVTVDARAGDDVVLIAPATGTAGALVAELGDGPGDTLNVSGSALSETITYQPSGGASGVVSIGTRTASFTETEGVLLDGGTTLPGADVLVVDTPTLNGTLVLDPGRSFDSGALAFRDATGASTAAPPLSFAGLGNGRVELPGATQADDLIYRGGSADNAFVVMNSSSDVLRSVIVLDAQLPVHTTGIHTLELDGAGGLDSFRVPAHHRFGGTDPGPGIVLRGGGTVGDHATILGAGSHIKVDLVRQEVAEGDLRPISHEGIARLTVEAGGAPVTAFGGAGPDALSFIPTGLSSGTLSAGGALVDFRGIGPAFSVDPGDGADTVTFVAQSVADDVRITRGNISTVAASGLQPFEVPLTAEALTVDAAGGSDTITVEGAGGPATLTVAGGDPTVNGDTLSLLDAVASITHSAVAGSGQMGSSGGPVQFSGIESILVAGDGTGDLTISGTGGPDTVTIGADATPTVRINDGAVVDHRGYPMLTVNAGGGQDATTLSYRSLGDATLVRVVGDAGVTDSVVLVDTDGATRRFTVTPTAADGAMVTASGHPSRVEIGSTEGLTIDGRGADDTVVAVTPSGNQAVSVVPAADASGGTVAVANLLPVAFQQLGAGLLRVQDTDGGRVDEIRVTGRSTSDAFTVEGTIDEVRLADWVRFNPAGAQALVLDGGDGDDLFAVSGPLPYASLVTDGAAPDLGDALRIDSPTGAVTVDLSSAAITGYGGVVSFPGVASLHTDIASQDLTQLGTARDDALCFDPQAPRDGRLYIVGAPAGGSAASVCLPDQRGLNVLHTFVDVGMLYVDAAGGMDEVIVNGTVERDLITVHALAPIAEVTVHPLPEQGGTFRLPLHVHVATTESVVIAADGGSDTIDVTTYDNPTTRFTVYGEVPDAKSGSDELYMRDGTGRASWTHTTGHEKGTGTVTASYPKGAGNTVRVDYDGIEYFKILRDPKA